MQRAWCICGIIIIIVMPLKLYVRRYDPPLALLRVINISMNPSSGPTSTNANKFNNDGYWKWKHMMWWDVNPVVRTGYFDVFVHAKIITSMYFTSMYLCVLTIIFVLIFIPSLSLCLSMFQRCQGQSVRIILWHWHQVSPDPGIHLQVTDAMLCPPWLSTFKKFW